MFYNRLVKKAPRTFIFLRAGILVVTGLLMLLPAACVAPPDERPWVYADLRVIGGLEAPSPATDILAVYTRSTALSVEVRIDLLDINPGEAFGLKIELWDDRDFSQSPLRIDISSTGRIQTSGIRAGRPDILPRVVQDASMDTVTVDLNRTFIGSRYRLDVSSYTSDPSAAADKILNVRSDAQPPAQRAPLLIAFWDTFPATTPAQALRRWDGAHTGPLGGRHGLTNILNGVIHSGVPVALLDIKNPASLAALSFMGNVLELQNLSADGLLILPDVAYGEPASVALSFSRRAAGGFGLPVSQFVYASPSDPSAGTSPTHGYRARFLALADNSHMASSAGVRLIPLPSADAVEATPDGPSLAVRQALIRAALTPDPTSLVVLGGSLPHSTWGDVEMSGPTFEWISAHPWIQPLAGQDLLTFPARVRAAEPQALQTKHPWLEELSSAPQNSITQSAWQAYLTLTSGTADTHLQALRKAYMGQIGELLAAAAWAENRTRRVDCAQDLNGDGRAECILADREYFAVLEPDGARMTFLFYYDAIGPHQLVGPSSQFALGLSDPSEWHPELGEAADPSVLPGAFTDDTLTWALYSPAIFTDKITFTSPDGSRIKTYYLPGNLVDTGIQVVYQGEGLVRTRIPLALDPQAFFSGPTVYKSTLGPHSWVWRLEGDVDVGISAMGGLSTQSFTSAIPFLALQEDPNLDYPAGNYLPFPLSEVTIYSSGIFGVQITGK
jgi:hypothetical protein